MSLGSSPGPSPTGRSGVRAGLLVGGGVLLLLGLGLLTLSLAWRHAAGTTLVPLQVPALVAAMVGAGLVGTALAAVDLHLGRRQDALEAESLADAVMLVRRWAEHRGPVRTD